MTWPRRNLRCSLSSRSATSHSRPSPDRRLSCYGVARWGYVEVYHGNELEPASIFALAHCQLRAAFPQMGATTIRQVSTDRTHKRRVATRTTRSGKAAGMAAFPDLLLVSMPRADDWTSTENIANAL
jgi:hypothetical protein